MAISSRAIIKTSDRSMIRPFYAKFKKHHCSRCGHLLSIGWVTHYGIKKGSKEDYGKSISFDYFNRPVDYTFAIFECSSCHHKVSIDDQYFSEHPDKLNKYNQKYGDYRLKDDYHIYLKSIEQRKE